MENSPKVHFGTPHLHARGILCQNSDMILHPDPARPSASSPAPEGAGAVLAIAPERRGGRAPLRGTVDSWTDVSQNSVKSIDLSPSRARYIVVCQKTDKHDSPLTLTREEHRLLSQNSVKAKHGHPHPHARGILAKRFVRILTKHLHPHPHARGGDDKILYGFRQVSETV